MAIESEYMEQIENDDHKNRLGKLQEEFHMSDFEVVGLTEFISSSQSNDILGIIEEVIKCENLNTRQKVAFAHEMGMFRMEESIALKLGLYQD